MKTMIRHFSLVLLFWFVCPLQIVGAEQTVPVADDSESRKLALIEIYSLSNELPRLIIDLQNEIDNLWSVSELGGNFPDLEKEIEDLTWEVNIAESTPDISYHQLALIDSKLEKARLRVERLNGHISGNVDELQAWYKRWLNRGEHFSALPLSEKMLTDSADVKQAIETIEMAIQSAKKLIEDKLVPNLIAGKHVGKIQTQLYVLNEKVTNLIEDTSELRIQQTSPSMLSKEFYKRLDARAFQQSWENVRLFLIYQWGYVKQNYKLVTMALLTISLFTLFIRLSRKLVIHSSRWFIFASRPLATAVFLFCVIFTTTNLTTVGMNLPPDWETLMNLPLLLAVTRFADQIVPVQWQNRFLRRLILFLAVNLLLTVINIPQPVFHLFVLYAALAVFGVSLYQFIQRMRDPQIKTVTWAIWLWGLFPLVIVAAGMSGYDQLAVLIFGRVLVLVAITITIWLTLQIVSGLLEVALEYFPYSIIRNNASTIVRQLVPFLVLLHGVWWLAVVLMIFWVHPTLTASFAALTSFTFHIFSLEVTPGSILTIIFVVYTTILSSRAVCAFLIQEVFPHYRVEKGVQVSIARLVHYAILSVGFLILLHTLGFGLNQIAILGGALSVGIGFGLQAIVNNFVSGLILLFERPIKVGDMIEVDQEFGEVKELGLRATTVQTYDNAEIVIPNSELISTRVTNWTLAEKKARVKIPIGVAYGTDIETVLKILIECANANPRVLSTPKPVALFLAFGASSLDFELRVWIFDVNDRLEILSELNVEIESEFQIADIEIPFLQTDLHIRSMDTEVAAVFSGHKSSEKEWKTWKYDSVIIGDLLYRGPLNIRRRLFRDVFGVVLVTVGALVALTLLQGRTVKDEISAQLISESNRLIKKRFSNYLDRCSTGLFLLARMGQASLLDFLSKKELAKVIIPVMDTYDGLHQVKIVDVAETGITFTRSASGYVSKILGKKELASFKNSELYTNVMAASGTNPVVWVNDVDTLSGITGLSAAIRVDQPHLERSLVIVFFIPASEIMTFIADIEVPDNVDIIFYNREGLFLSRKQLREKNDVVTGFMLMGRDEAPAETRKALSLWLSDGGDVQSVKKFMLNGITWWAGYSPLSDKNEFTWVSIVIPETDIVSDVKKQWLHLGLMAGGILLFAVLLTIGLVRKYGFQLKDLPHRQTVHANLAENVRKFIAAGESPTVEFKSTMRTNLQSGKTGKEIELAWLKGVVAFMNTDGGIVLIGVSDSGEILGIDSDGFASEDKCSLHFKNLINTHLGAELARYVHLRFCSINEKTVLMIECERVREPVFLKVGKSEEFYVRSGPSSMKLTISQAVHYLARR